MNKHKLTLMGGSHRELRVPAGLLHKAIGVLLTGARQAVRVTVEGESLRKGPRPSWLDAACALDITGLHAGSAALVMEAPMLREADPEQFGERRQRSLFEETDRDFTEHTAIDLFGQILATIIEGDADDIVADRALLDTCIKFAKLSGSGYEGVKLEGLHGRDTPLVITAEHIPKIELLRDKTPPSQAARVSGVLDTISASQSDVILKLKDGSKVPARIEDHNPDALRQLFGKSVVISGIAHYRPSGRLRLLSVESIGAAQVGDQLFEAEPVALQRSPVVTPQTQDASSGVSAFFGTWPGDESEDELLDDLGTIG